MIFLLCLILPQVSFYEWSLVLFSLPSFYMQCNSKVPIPFEVPNVLILLRVFHLPFHRFFPQYKYNIEHVNLNKGLPQGNSSN